MTWLIIAGIVAVCALVTIATVVWFKWMDARHDRAFTKLEGVAQPRRAESRFLLGGRFLMTCEEGRLRTNDIQIAECATERVRSMWAQGSREQPSDTQAPSGLLMCLTAAMFVASAVISLNLLWCAILGIQWLLLR